MSIKAHPFGPLLYILFTLTALICLAGWIYKFKFNAGYRPIQKGITILLAAFLIFGAYRFATTPNYASPAERQLQLVRRF